MKTQKSDLFADYCNTCEYLKPIDLFRGKTGFHRDCRSCREYKKDNFRLQKYGIYREEYESILADQEEVCAIFENPEQVKTPRGFMRELSVDHCHKTGKIRGLLCHSCNVAIGLLKENPDNFTKALEYLKRSSNENE